MFVIQGELSALLVFLSFMRLSIVLYCIYTFVLVLSFIHLSFSSPYLHHIDRFLTFAVYHRRCILSERKANKQNGS